MTTMIVVGECFFWYRLTRVVPDRFHRAIKRLCVCVCVCINKYTHMHTMASGKMQMHADRSIARNICTSEQSVMTSP